MAPLVLEGETLGQKHRHFNQLVEAAVTDKAELLPINYDDPDVDNLVKIDVACRRRNVDYILDVLQSDDMLFVSRVIKQSTWLITDDQYAHIINPNYLHNTLFPKITSKAKNKLLLAIRLHLRNESRVEEFYNYYSDDIKVAQKWLPRCSLAHIEKVYVDHINEISADTFKRLCESSISIVKILLKNKNWYYIGNQLAASKILIKKYAEEYVELIKNLEDYNIPIFGVRATQQLMDNCPEQIVNNFEKFARHIHLPTFAKCLKKEDIPVFLTKQAENNKMKHWVKYDNIKHFVKYLPIATRFEFVKRLFIDKEPPKPQPRLEGEVMMCAMPKIRLCSAPVSSAFTSSNANIYRWYRFAHFDAAFTDLKKLIRVESSPAERNAMLTILIHCARRNPQQIHTLLQYYREKHMNEPFKFKVQFVNAILSLVATYKFDANTWGILNDIFSSMEVYAESENSVPYCVKAIIVYKLLHNEDIPDIIVKKHTFDTFKDYRKKLQEREQNIIFTYLYESEMKKLNKQTINNEIEMDMAFAILKNVMTLMKEWERKFTDCPEVLQKIRLFIKAKKENSFKYDLSHIYDVEKKWRRHMFEESLVLELNDAACVNALKHNPGLLLRCSADVQVACSNDAVSIKNTLSKLRIYWAQSLAQEWAKSYYLDRLENPTGNKATVEGICILLPRKQFLSLLEKYTPVETKIDWSNSGNEVLTLQKNIAKQMKLVRPSLKLDAILSYAKGDYLQFALPSLNSLLYNMSAAQVSEYIPILFESPVSLKKHGVRLAYTKLKFSEIKELVENMWINTKNSTIKTVLFKETYELLKKEKKDSAIKELWQLLNMFIENLTQDENRVIYNTLGKAVGAPMAVRSKFFMKSYTYLKSLPAKANCESILTALKHQASDMMHLLEPSFVENYLLVPVDEYVKMITGKPDNSRNDLNIHTSILTSYILSSENEEIQYNRYEKYLIPVLNVCFEFWKTFKNKDLFVLKNNFFEVLKGLIRQIKSSVLNKTVISVKIFKDIETKLRTALPLEENYLSITYWTIGTLFVESVNTYMTQTDTSAGDHSTDDNEKKADTEQLQLQATVRGRKKTEQEENDKKWEELCTALAPVFGKSCLNFLKQDITIQFPTLAVQFSTTLTHMFGMLDLPNIPNLITLKHMLDNEVALSYVIVLNAMEGSYYDRDDKVAKLKREIYGIIGTHQSLDVKVYYHEAMKSQPQTDEEAIPY